MTDPSAFVLYNLVVGAIAAAGLLYLGYARRRVVGYRRFVFLLVGGLLLFTLGGPIADLLAPEWTHLVHGLAALLIVFGLYDPVHNDLRKDEWMQLTFEDPAQHRAGGDWMRPMDDRILELFHSNELVLTPAIIAYNLDYSSKEVNRRLSELDAHGFVERVERGKYQLTDVGELYLEGTLLTDRDSNTAAGLTNR